MARWSAPHPGGFRADRQVFLDRLARDAKRVGPYSYRHHTRAAVKFDAMSVADWIAANVPGGTGGLQGRLVAAEMACDFALDADQLSALNLFYEYVEHTPGADERYHVRGGNDQVVTQLADGLSPGAIQLGAALEGLWQRPDGSLGISVTGSSDVIVDHVALCLPFSTLRHVDLAGVPLSARKRACIEELGMGTNAKVLLRFAGHPPDYGRWNGNLTSDAPALLSWDSTLRQRGTSSIITMFLGGRAGGGGLHTPYAHGAAPEPVVEAMLDALDHGGATNLPGLVDHFSGRAWVDHWSADPWALGSYAAYLPGQYTRYYGFVGRAEGRVHFGGEHTATANQGYLEGAVRSGERCAYEILAAGTA